MINISSDRVEHVTLSQVDIAGELKNNPFNFSSYFSSARLFLNEVLHNC